MRKLLSVVMLLVGGVLSLSGGGTMPVLAQAEQPDIFIQQPRQGEPLQGVETVSGKIRGDLFRRAEISFAYAGLEQPTWFFLAEFTREDIAESSRDFTYDWDTTRITDGEYHLRVRAEYEDGELVEVVEGLRIRNYSPIETRTPGPEPTREAGEVLPTLTVQPTRQLTPTPLPPNPASLTSGNIFRSLRLGLTAAGVLFGTGGLYLLARNVRRRSR